MTEKKKPTLTRVTHLVASVFLFGLHSDRRRLGAPPWGGTGSQVERGMMGGEFPPRSPTVLTAAHWLHVASLLKRDTCPAARAGARGCWAEGGSQAVVSDTSTKRRASRKVMSEVHSALSYLKWSVVCACMCALSALLCVCLSSRLSLSLGVQQLPCDRCTQTGDIFSNT